MAFNNFTSVRLNDDGDLVAQGVTTKAAPTVLEPDPAKESIAGQEIDVVVISCDPGKGKRCDATVFSPDSGSWPAIARAGTHSFANGDEVFVVGSAKAPGKPLDTWSQKFKVGGDGPLTA